MKPRAPCPTLGTASGLLKWDHLRILPKGQLGPAHGDGVRHCGDGIRHRLRGHGDVVMPVTVLGVRADENLQVTKEGGGRLSTYRPSSAAIPSSFSPATRARRSRFALTKIPQDSIR